MLEWRSESTKIFVFSSSSLATFALRIWWRCFISWYYTMLFCSFKYWYICVLHSIFFELFCLWNFIFHPSNCCYCTKCTAFAFRTMALVLWAKPFGCEKLNKRDFKLLSPCILLCILKIQQTTKTYSPHPFSHGSRSSTSCSDLLKLPIDDVMPSSVCIRHSR